MPRNVYLPKVRSLHIIYKVASHILKVNATPKRTIIKTLNISNGTLNKITTSDLKQIKEKKTFYSLTDVKKYFSA